VLQFPEFLSAGKAIQRRGWRSVIRAATALRFN
jgi:hypothetical protein